jgi:hypothetical protein
MRRFALAPVLACAAQPAFASQSLFDAFKRFCIDTDADPSSVKTAAEAAGGVPGPAGATGDPWPDDDGELVLQGPDGGMIALTHCLVP